jgi:hypothetical protein
MRPQERTTSLQFSSPWVDVLGNAYDIIDSIYSTLTKGGTNPLLAALIALASMPAAIAISIGKVGLERALGTNLGEGIEGMKAGIVGLLKSTVSTNPYVVKAYEGLKKIISLFEWIYSLWQSFWSWIQTAVPGVAKDNAKQKMEKDIEKTNKGSDKWAVTYEYNNKRFAIRDSTIPNAAANYATTQEELTKYVGAGRAKKLTKEAKTYEDLPSFAQGIADAVKAGMSGVGSEIATAITGKFSFPSFDKLIESLDSLVTPLDGLLKIIREKLGVKDHTGETPAFESTMGKAYLNSDGTYDVEATGGMHLQMARRIHSAKVQQKRH